MWSLAELPRVARVFSSDITADDADVASELSAPVETGPIEDLRWMERGLSGVVALLVAAAVTGATDASPLIVAGALVAAPLSVYWILR